MSIVVYYLRQSEPETGADTGAATGPETGPEAGAPADTQTQWLPHCLAYTDQQMSEALAQCQRLRADPRNMHVVISSELRDMVGQIGVAAVENGHTPDGERYDWSKAGRAGNSRKNAMEPPKTKAQRDE